MGENWSTRTKTSLSTRGDNQQQTQPTYGIDAGIWTRVTLAGGDCSTTAPFLPPKEALQRDQSIAAKQVWDINPASVRSAKSFS